MDNKVEIGKVFFTKEGYKFVVVDYTGNSFYKIRFENGYEVRAKITHIKSGVTKNPYHRTVFGVGYLGEKGYQAHHKGKSTHAYSTWFSMMRRCYCEKSKILQPAYIDCTVDEEWHNFQNYAEWYYNNPYAKVGWCLDKDIIVQGDRVYHKDYCTFVPQEINASVIYKSTTKYGLPRGVSKHRYDSSKYTAYVWDKHESKYKGVYETPEEAYAEYVRGKKKKFLDLVEKYKGKVDPRVCDALINWDFTIS